MIRKLISAFRNSNRNPFPNWPDTVCNHAAFTRGVLTSFMNPLVQPCARKYSGEAWPTHEAGSHQRNKSSFLVFMLDTEPGGFVYEFLLES
jgi:hypothetical protein